METLARRVKPCIMYNGKDISADVTDSLISLSYTDNMSGTADDIRITLEDSKGLWSGPWLPEKGAQLDVSWTLEHWENVAMFNAGTFELDEISCGFQPSTIDINAVSIVDNGTLRGVEHTRSWEKVTLKKVCQDIADDAGLELSYNAPADPFLDRTEQTEESDLAYLLNLCRDNGFALKIIDNKIVIFDEAEYDSQEPALALTKLSDITSASFTSKLRDIYKACHVKYQQSSTKRLIEYTFTAPDKQDGKTLLVKEEVSNVAEAERLAKKRLREKNCEEVTGSISCVGRTDLVAATVINVVGFGAFDGKYIIVQAQHDISSSGYTCSLSVRRCLDGY